MRCSAILPRALSIASRRYTAPLRTMSCTTLLCRHRPNSPQRGQPLEALGRLPHEVPSPLPPCQTPPPPHSACPPTTPAVATALTASTGLGMEVGFGSRSEGEVQFTVQGVVLYLEARVKDCSHSRRMESRGFNLGNKQHKKMVLALTQLGTILFASCLYDSNAVHPRSRPLWHQWGLIADHRRDGPLNSRATRLPHPSGGTLGGPLVNFWPRSVLPRRHPFSHRDDHHPHMPTLRAHAFEPADGVRPSCCRGLGRRGCDRIRFFGGHAIRAVTQRR